MRDRSHMPELRADIQQLQMHHKITLCLPAFCKSEGVLKSIQNHSKTHA